MEVNCKHGLLFAKRIQWYLCIITNWFIKRHKRLSHLVLFPCIKCTPNIANTSFPRIIGLVEAWFRVYEGHACITSILETSYPMEFLVGEIIRRNISFYMHRKVRIWLFLEPSVH